MRHKIGAKIGLLWMISIFYACSASEVNLPEGILSEQEMVEVIADIQVLDAAQKRINISTEKKNAMRDTTYSIIFNKHQTTAAEFDSSLRTYARYPQMMGDIMENVAKRVNK